MKYKVSFGEIEIGEVFEEGDHLPYVSGKFIFSDSFISSSDSFVKKLKNYIECSVLFAKRNDWNIVSQETGYRTPIFPPSFLGKDKISLRLNLK